MYGRIYCITNLVNGKRYVGQTTFSIARRWAVHCNRASKGSKLLLHRAIAKHGEKAFCVSELGSFNDAESLNAAEVKWIEELRTLAPLGYNLTSGGEGGKWHAFTKVKVSATRKKMIASDRAIVDRMQTPSARAKAKMNRAATESSPEWKRKITKIRKAMWASLEAKEKLRAVRKVQGARPELKAKWSAAATAHWQDPEYRAKVAATKARSRQVRELLASSCPIKQALGRALRLASTKLNVETTAEWIPSSRVEAQSNG